MERLSQHMMEEKMIDNILKNFNFKKCHNAMKALDWQ
jgi:hypothetical protein